MRELWPRILHGGLGDQILPKVRQGNERTEGSIDSVDEYPTNVRLHSAEYRGVMCAHVVDSRYSTIEPGLTSAGRGRSWLRHALESVRIVAGDSAWCLGRGQESAMKNNLDESSSIDSGKRSDG